MACISAWLTPPETILASLERAQRDLSNDAKLVSGDVDGAEIQTLFGFAFILARDPLGPLGRPFQSYDRAGEVHVSVVHIA